MDDAKAEAAKALAVKYFGVDNVELKGLTICIEDVQDLAGQTQHAFTEVKEAAGVPTERPK